MKKIKLYSIRPEWLYGEEEQPKREAQLTALQALGLKETPDKLVICTAEQAMGLLMSWYCGQHPSVANCIQEVAQVDGGPDVEDLFQILADKIAAIPASFNDKCNQHQPNNALFTVAETMLLENSCTDALQEKLALGWRIIAVQPQPDQRRPDYILGRYPMSAQRG